MAEGEPFELSSIEEIDGLIANGTFQIVHREVNTRPTDYSKWYSILYIAKFIHSFIQQTQFILYTSTLNNQQYFPNIIDVKVSPSSELQELREFP